MLTEVSRGPTMADWAGWACGSLCVAFGLIKFVAGGLAILELRRKWWAVPELGGLDWLDIVYRVEREFGVTLAASDFAGVSPEARNGLTAGGLWEVIRAKPGFGVAIAAADGWARFAALLGGVLNVKPGQVTPAARLIADLRLSNAFE